MVSTGQSRPGAIITNPSGTGTSRPRWTTNERRWRLSVPIRRSARPSSRQSSTPQGLLVMNESAPPSRVKPSRCSVQIGAAEAVAGLQKPEFQRAAGRDGRGVRQQPVGGGQAGQAPADDHDALRSSRSFAQSGPFPGRCGARESGTINVDLNQLGRAAIPGSIRLTGRFEPSGRHSVGIDQMTAGVRSDRREQSSLTGPGSSAVGAADAGGLVRGPVGFPAPRRHSPPAAYRPRAWGRRSRHRPTGRTDCHNRRGSAAQNPLNDAARHLIPSLLQKVYGMRCLSECVEPVDDAPYGQGIVASSTTRVRTRQVNQVAIFVHLLVTISADDLVAGLGSQAAIGGSG